MCCIDDIFSANGVTLGISLLQEIGLGIVRLLQQRLDNSTQLVTIVHFSRLACDSRKFSASKNTKRQTISAMALLNNNQRLIDE